MISLGPKEVLEMVFGGFLNGKNGLLVVFLMGKTVFNGFLSGSFGGKNCFSMVF